MHINLDLMESWEKIETTYYIPIYKYKLFITFKKVYVVMYIIGTY